MDEQLQEDWLDARLRDDAPYVDDAGFTAQVMQKLPVRRAGRLSFRATLMLCITLLASALTYFASGGGRFVETALHYVAELPALIVSLPFWLTAVIVALCAILATFAAVGAALAQTRQTR
jgi:hypothetical protein